MVSKIDIKIILDLCKEPFVVVKKDGDLYEYKIGGDIDIFTNNATILAKQILEVSTINNEFPPCSFCMSDPQKPHNDVVYDNRFIRVITPDKHIQIDFMDGDILIVRLDIIDTLDIFKEKLLQNDRYAQLAFRLFEYALYPNKSKHLKFVKDKLLKYD